MLKFLICVKNKNYETSLEKWKIYPVVKEEEMEGYVRIIDESGEDYLYPKEYFLPTELPAIVSEKVKKEYLDQV
ncbi:hypothetical protein SAMN04488516_10526 [Desulfonauticus submarinus]|uniref:Uncharacterized protein n=1 Tax=Desulfonauticus submarinus TaxID=206665 RepID=A0A1H0DHT8_9BACT|nr:hypothetical protein [Desulfonauticus submarinus]SDN69710.1 hypothetical protein SAMN04488516_10526 [Desulfonauticus submarinus]